jgi:SAM-dependent methyltransferase
MALASTFEQLVAEGESEPIEGWDFSWFEGRATEERPSWNYSEALGQRVAQAGAVLDVQTGGGERLAEMLSQIDTKPRVIFATESWGPNVAIAKQNLRPFDASVIEIADDAAFPLPNEGFDLVSSRHPTITLWGEIARVLKVGGVYFSQQVGAGTNSELADFMMGAQPVSDSRSTQRAVAEAHAVGLEVLEVREESLPIVFFDVGAVVYFLRKVIWTVPGFTVERYRDRLMAMHRSIEAHGGFASHAQRFLIEAKRLNPR